MSKTDVITRMLDVESIVLNPAFKTRKQDHDEAGIERIAKSYEYRSRNGINPVQIMDVVVTPADDDGKKYFLVDGEGRYKAALLVNEAGGIEGEPMKLRAKIVKGDTPANTIITGLQANFHDAIDVFDQADVAGKLQAEGMKQKDIASALGVSEGRVSQMLPLNKVPKKYIQAYRDGDLEQDAVIAIASMEADDDTKTVIMEEAMRHRQRLSDILAKREHKAKKEELTTQIAEAKSKVDEHQQTAKELDKEIKKVEAEAAKTEDEKALKKVREQKAELEKQRKAAEKALRDAAKELEKAKEAKEKLSENPPTKKVKATAEDVKEAAKDRGVKGADKGSARSKATVYAELEALAQDEKNALPEPAKILIAKMQAFFDGEITTAQLRNAFVFSCRNEDELEKFKASRKK